MLTRDEAKKLAQRALSFSKFPECDIAFDSTENVFIRFALNGLTTSGVTVEQSMSITSTREGRSGSTKASEFDDASLRKAVELTEQLALISPPSPETVRPLEPQKYREIASYPESSAKSQSAVMIQNIRSVIQGAKSKNLIAAGFIESSEKASTIANKQGNFGYARTKRAGMSATVRTADGSSSGWATQPAVRIEDIDGASIGNAAIDKCLRWKAPKLLDPGKYTVVLEPAAVGGLVSFLSRSLQARAAEEGRSFLSKKGGGTLQGAKIFPDLITLRTDPFHARFSSVPWSSPRSIAGGRISSGGGERTPAEPTTWIDKGVVKNLVYDRYWASKTNKPVTPAPLDLVLEGTDKTLEQLIASVDRGLLVTRFYYVRVVNPQTVQLTGLTRDGLFLIEKGKVTVPVVNFRFNESPVRMLQNTVAVGKSTRVPGAGEDMVAPALVATDFLFTSISDAV